MGEKSRPESSCNIRHSRRHDDDSAGPYPVAEDLNFDLATRLRKRKPISWALILAACGCCIWLHYHRPLTNWLQTRLGGNPVGIMNLSNTQYTDLTQVQDLDVALLPGGPGDSSGERRLIFIGDVHGCKAELTELLHKVEYRSGKDHLILTGDTISKGPDSVGVLDDLIKISAESVRGNHEDQLLTVGSSLTEQSIEMSLHTQLSSSEITTSRNKKAEQKLRLFESLNKHHLKYLHSMPLILRIPALPFSTGHFPKDQSQKHRRHRLQDPILVVHAGLVPGIPLQKQDPYFVMNMRTINPKTLQPSVERSATLQADRNDQDQRNSQTDGQRTVPWYEFWNQFNEHASSQQQPKQGFEAVASYVPAKIWAIADELSRFFGIALWKRKALPPHVVIYGHDSRQGLQLHPWSKGLDSGCVNGGELSALVLDAWGFWDIVSVPCRNWRD